MSDVLFPRAKNRAALRLRLAALAAAVAVAFGAVAGWVGLSFVGLVGGSLNVTAHVTTLGDSLGVNSYVKFRGLRIGRVVGVSAKRDKNGQYDVRATLEQQFAGQVPAAVKARVLPGTIFGAEYVELEPEAAPAIQPAAATTSGPMLRSGSQIPADTSPETARLMDTLTATQRMLGAIDPSSMDEALTQLADALDGKGDDLARFVQRANALLGQVQDQQPVLYGDLDLIERNLATAADLEPALAATLRNSLPVAQTIASKHQQVDRLVSGSNHLALTISTFLEQHAADLTAFLEAVAPTYRAFVGGIGPFSEILQRAPGVLANGASDIVDHAIQMYAKFSLNRPPSYTRQDCPRYGTVAGSNC